MDTLLGVGVSRWRVGENWFHVAEHINLFEIKVCFVVPLHRIRNESIIK